MANWLHPNQHVRKLIGMGVVTVLMALWGWWLFNWLTPPQHNPFKPLDLVSRPGLATGYKLDRLAASPAQCFALLDAAGQEPEVGRRGLLSALFDPEREPSEDEVSAVRGRLEE